MIDLEDIAGEIIDLFRNVVTNVINPFYEFEVKDSELPQLLHYGVDGHYMPHCDGESLWKPPGNEPLIWRKSTDRDLSTVLFLNDDFEGGDFVFPELNRRVWEPGDFILHLTGYETEPRTNLINQMSFFTGGKIVAWNRDREKIYFRPLEDLKDVKIVLLSQERKELINWDFNELANSVIYFLVIEENMDLTGFVLEAKSGEKKISSYRPSMQHKRKA
jgi:hypothetical protein